MATQQNILSENGKEKNFCSINQGDCVHLKNKADLFQVIGIDDEHEKCWVRQWPLLANGSPVFEISMQQVYI